MHEIHHVVEHGRHPAQRAGEGADEGFVVDAWVEVERDLGAVGLQCLGELHSVALRVDQAVDARCAEEGARHAGVVNVVDGHAAGGVVGEVENRLDFSVGDGQKVVGPGQPDPPGQIGAAQTDGVQPARVERQHGGVVGTGAVAHQVDLVRVAAPMGDVLRRPGDGAGVVAQEVGVAHFGIEAVIGNDGDDAARSQRLADETVHGAVAAGPAAAVEKHDHRGTAGLGLAQRGSVGPVDVQRFARGGAVGDVATEGVGVGRGEPVDQGDRRTGDHERGEAGQGETLAKSGQGRQ